MKGSFFGVKVLIDDNLNLQRMGKRSPSCCFHQVSVQNELRNEKIVMTEKTSDIFMLQWSIANQ